MLFTFNNNIFLRLSRSFLDRHSVNCVRVQINYVQYSYVEIIEALIRCSRHDLISGNTVQRGCRKICNLQRVYIRDCTYNKIAIKQ